MTQAAGPIKVKPFAGSMQLAQLSGVPLTLCILNEKHEQLHAPVMCKDYIQDAWWSEIHKRKADIYGFYWKPGSLSLDVDTYDLALAFGSAELVAKADRVLSLLHAWEERLGFKKSELLKTDKPLQLVLRFSKEWTEQPIRISLLTLMLRVGTEYEGQAVGSYLDAVSTHKFKLMYAPDAYIVKGGLGRLKNIWETRKFPAQRYQAVGTISECHNYTGIYCYRDGAFA